MFTICPKCRHQVTPTQTGDPGICPKCGLVFAKWVQHQSGTAPVKADLSALDENEGEAGSLRQRLWQLLTYVPERTDPRAFWGRVALYVAFLVWGWYFILLDFRSAEIMSSFMHTIDLVFHEAGHVIFRPFGEFMTTLGGSLNQLLIPIIVMVALLWKNRDGFGASIALWWLGQSLMDLAPYINDARELKLMLLGGGTGADRPGVHDWENILLDLNMIKHDHQIAAAADALGSLLVMLAMSWGAYILYLQYARMKGPV